MTGRDASSIKVYMQRFSMKLVFAAVIVCLMAQSALADEAANKIAAQVDKKYNSLQTFNNAKSAAHPKLQSRDMAPVVSST